MNIDEVIKKQREFFKSGKTIDIEYRINALKKLYKAVKKYENEIKEALYSDLGKSEYEGFMCETGLVLSEIGYMIKHTKKYAREKTVKTPLTNFAAHSFVKPSPYGNVLIMSPWNYPLLLTLDPLADAIAAGNTAIVKPSAYSPKTSELIKKMIDETFDAEYIFVITGGRKENAELLNKKFDMVFFTGSQNVGKEVLRHTAETLTPAVLELGGKSPCIVEGSAKIKLAARRIVFGKFLNCGQTCVAPDYILCESSVKDELIKEIKNEIKKQYGDKPLSNKDYGKIVNEKHFERLLGLIDKDKVIYGGGFDRENLKIEPTVMDNVTFSDDVMGEEIFGPIMPIITYKSFDDIFEILKDRQKPLALYIFSEDKKHIKKIKECLSFGGGCVNDTIIHLATSEMGFGGVGESGMGAYHGKTGFDAFSHKKSMVDKKTWIDFPIRYQPYSKGIFEKLLHFLLR